MCCVLFDRLLGAVSYINPLEGLQNFSHRDRSIDLLDKPIAWFLYD